MSFDWNLSDNEEDLEKWTKRKGFSAVDACNEDEASSSAVDSSFFANDWKLDAVAETADSNDEDEDRNYPFHNDIRRKDSESESEENDEGVEWEETTNQQDNDRKLPARTDQTAASLN